MGLMYCRDRVLGDVTNDITHDVIGSVCRLSRLSVYCHPMANIRTSWSVCL
jgi:hypothetical protein